MIVQGDFKLNFSDISAPTDSTFKGNGMLFWYVGILRCNIENDVKNNNKTVTHTVTVKKVSQFFIGNSQ